MVSLWRFCRDLCSVPVHGVFCRHRFQDVLVFVRTASVRLECGPTAGVSRSYSCTWSHLQVMMNVCEDHFSLSHIKVVHRCQLKYENIKYI